MGLFDDLLEEEDEIQPTQRRGLFDDLLEGEELVRPTAPPRTTAPQAQLLPPIEEMFKPKPKPTGDGFFRQAADIPVGLAKGAAQGVRMFTDIAGADNPVSQSIRGVEDYLGNLMSAQAKEDQAEIARIMQDAQDKGVLDQVMAGVKAFSVAPVDMTVQALGTMAPVIVGGLAANTAKLAATGIRAGVAGARGLTAGQMAATQAGIGAGMGAGVVKGTIYDEVKNELVSQGLSEDAAHEQAVKAQEYGGKNLDQILLGAGLGAAAATTGAEKIIGGILTKTGVGASKSSIANALKAGVTEAFPEAAQGAQEQLAANLALQREGMEVPATRGVFSSGALEGIAGFGVGAPLGAIQKASVAEDAAIKAEEASAPQTAAAIRAAGQKAATEEKDISATEQAIEETEAAMRPTVPIGEEFVMPPKEEFKVSYATLSPEALAETEASFQEQLQDEDADTRAFAQTALEALAEFKAEQTPVPPTPVRKAELPTDALPIETPAATYGREEGVYDVFADVRRQPLPPSGPAFESAQVIEQELSRAETLRQSPEGRAQLRRELQGEQMTGEVRRAVEQALATTPEVVEEGDVFAEVRRPTEVSPAEPTPVAPAEVETAASLSRVADNTATDEEVVRLARQGLVNIQDGQNVITPRGEEVMQRGGAPLPKLTPEERAAEIAATPAIVEQAPPVAEAPAVTPAPAAERVVPITEPTEAVEDIEAGAPPLSTENLYFENNLAQRAWRIAAGFKYDKERGDWFHPSYPDLFRGNAEQEITDTNPPTQTQVRAVLDQLRQKYTPAIKEVAPTEIATFQKGDMVRVPNRVPVYEKGEVVGGRTVMVGGSVTRVMPDGKVEVRLQQGGYATLPPAQIEMRKKAPTPVTTPPVTEAVTPAPEIAAATTAPVAETPAVTEAPAAEVAPAIEPLTDDQAETIRDVITLRKSQGREPNPEQVKRLAEYDARKAGVDVQEGDIVSNIVVGHPMFEAPQPELSNLVPIKVQNKEQLASPIQRTQQVRDAAQSYIGQYQVEQAKAKTPAQKKAFAKKFNKSELDRQRDILDYIKNDVMPELDRLEKSAPSPTPAVSETITPAAEPATPAVTRSFVPPLVSTMMDAISESASILRSRISNVRLGSIFEDEQSILFELDGNTYKGFLRGRNRDLVVNFDSEADASIAARVLVDRDAEPVSPAAEPAGISVGNRVKTKTTPQSFVVEEVLPQSEREVELGEQYYNIKNERTGEVQTVEANDIKIVKGKGAKKMAAAPAKITPQTPEETAAFQKASSNKVMARNPELAVAAVRLANGEITAGDYADLIDSIDPFTTKGAESVPTKDKIDQYIGEDKRSKVNAPIQSGKEVEFRIDIPTYNRSTAAGDTVYAVTAHEPVPETSTRVGTPISYLGVAKVINPKMMTRSISGKGEAIDIATGAGKFPLATVKGNYEAITELPTDINDPNVWTEVSYNPIRSSYFVDVRSKNAVVGGDEAIMVGSRVFVKNPQMQSRPTGIVGGAGVRDIKYIAAEIRVEEKVQPVPEAERYTFEEAGIRAIKFFGGVAPEGLLIVNDSVDPDYRMKAGYDPETGQIILNRAFIRKGDSIEDILTHELGHYIFSDPKFQADFKNFLDSMPDNTRAQIEAIINKSYNKDTNQTQIEERQVMAFTALVKASKQSLSAWENLKNTIKRWINRVLRTNIKLSDEGAMAVFNVGYKRFKRGDQIVRAMEEGVLRMAPELEAAPAEKPARRTKMQNIIDISTGVRRPRTKLTVDEMAALKDQIRIGARKRREDKQTQKEFAKDVTEYLRGMAIRGKVSAPQLRAITNKAMQTQFDNEASIKGFLNYANKVIENANYNKDISEAKAAIKRARQLADQKKGSPQTKAILASFGVVDPKEIEPENMDERDVEVDGVVVREKPISVAEFTSVLKEYMKAFAPVTAEGYVVIPDAEMVDFLSKVGAQIKQNQDATKNIGFDGELAEIADKTPKQIEEELARDEERRKRIENKVNKLAEAAQIGLAKYDNPDLNADEKDILDFMKRATLSDMDLGNRKDYIRIANDILVNNKFFGAEKFASIAEGQIGAAEAARDSKTVKRNDALIKGYYQLFGEETGREIALGMQSLSDTLRNITRPEEGVRLLYQMGFGKLERGRAAANSEKRKFTDAMDVRLKQIEKKTGQSINDGQGLVSSGVAATLIQTAPDETQAEGIQRMRGLIEADIERKKNSWRKEDRMTAALVEQALKEVYADSVDGILANLKKTHPANYEVLTFLMDTVLPSYKPLFKQHDEMFNNQTDNYDNPFYLPIKYRRVVTEPVDPAEGIGNRMQSVASPKQSVNSIKRVKNTVLPENMQFDYNLIRNVIDSVASQLDAAYMNPGLQQVHAFLTSENAAKALGGAENLEIVRRRINSLAESRDRKSYDMTGWSRVFDTLANGVRNISTTMLLGGIGQVAKQAPAQMLTTVINVNDANITGTAAFEIKAALPVMQQFSIGERGEIAGGARWINQLDTGYSKLERYIESGLWSKVKDVAQNLGDVWLAALKKSDSVAAGHGWISYYKKYLKDNNIPFTNWDNEAKLVAEGDRDRVQAGLYADTQIDIYQGASDPTKMATFAQRGKSGAENMMKTIFLPFSSFAIQERTRFLSDLRDATYGSTEEKKRAAKGLASTIAGIATFHWVRRYVLPFFFGYLAYGLYGMLGVEMEELDEEKEKEMKDRTFKKFLGELAANITVGGYSSLAENAMIDAVNMMSYEYDKLNENENVMTEDGEIMSWETYQKKRAPFYRYTGPGADTSLGMFDVIPDQLKSVKDKLADLSDEELMDSLTEEEKRVLILAGFSDMLYTLRLNDTDVARMINKMSKDVKTQAEEREKEQRKLMRMFQ